MEQLTSAFKQDQEEGVHSNIGHPAMRALWRESLKHQMSVPWPLWWKFFPKALAPHVAAEEMEALKQLLSTPEAKLQFQRRAKRCARVQQAPGRVHAAQLAAFDFYDGLHPACLSSPPPPTPTHRSYPPAESIGVMDVDTAFPPDASVLQAARALVSD